MGRTKVLIVCGAGIVSGKEIMALELTRGLRSSGLQIHVLTTTWGDGAFPRKLEEAGLPFRRLPLGFISATLTLRCLYMSYEQFKRWPGLLLGYRSLLQTLRPIKVIHDNWQHLLLLLPFLRPSRDLFWVHDVIPNKLHYKMLFKILSRRLQCFVAVSCAVAESLRRIGIPDQRIELIHNGLVAPSMESRRSPTPNSIKKLGIVGQIGSWKGHGDLLEAFGQIAARFPDTELHIFGRQGSNYEVELRQRAAELGVADKVKWHGFVSDREAIFETLDILAVPSRVEESFGLVAAEAGFFGVPIVATRRGGLLEIVEDGITGILVPSDDPAALAEGIERLLADPEMRFAMGVRARERMVTLFSRERFVNEFLLLLGVNSTVDDRPIG